MKQRSSKLHLLALLRLGLRANAPYSPVTNPNLILRSEIVALFNTLHQFSESLMAVDEFRRIWARKESSSEGLSFQQTEGDDVAVSLEL